MTTVALPTTKEVIAQLNRVIDPELDIPITDMGLIYDTTIQSINDAETKVIVKMTLTTIGCPLFDVIADDIVRNIKKLPTVTEVEIDLTFDPAWTPDMMNDSAKAELGWE